MITLYGFGRAFRPVIGETRDLRAQWARSGIGRAFYCFLVGKRIVIVHAFVKKTEQTPDKELKLARRRVRELQDG